MSDADEQQATCHYHPAQPAYVRCGACGKPLCPDCVQHGPVGTRCVECLLGIRLVHVGATTYVAAAVGAMAVALVVGGGLGFFGVLNWVTAIGLGLAVGEVTKVIVHRTATVPARAIAGVAAGLGAYYGVVAHRFGLLLAAGAPTREALATAMTADFRHWVLAALVATGVAIYWVRRQ